MICQPINNTSNSKENHKTNSKTFCTWCFKGGRPATHKMKDGKGQIVCPDLLAKDCQYCNQLGHFMSHCPVRLAHEREQAEINRNIPRMIYNKNNHSPKSLVQSTHNGAKTNPNLLPPSLMQKTQLNQANSPIQPLNQQFNYQQIPSQQAQLQLYLLQQQQQQLMEQQQQMLLKQQLKQAAPHSIANVFNSPASSMGSPMNFPLREEPYLLPLSACELGSAGSRTSFSSTDSDLNPYSTSLAFEPYPIIENVYFEETKTNHFPNVFSNSQLTGDFKPYQLF